MKKQLITLFFLCSVAFVSCDDDDEHPTPAPTNSLRTGTKFTFTRTDFDLATTRAPHKSDFTITLVEDTTINGTPWWVAVIAEPSATQYTLIQVTDEGLFTFKNGNILMDYKFNPATSDTWTNSSGETVQVKAVNENITVPGGSFTDVTLIETSDANSMENKFWYNKEELLLIHEEYDEDPAHPGQMVIDYRDELKSVVW